MDEFQQLAAEALRSDDIAGFQSALSIYEGDLLIEDPYEDWVTERREQLRLLHQELLAKLARLHLSRNEHQQSRERLKELVTCDPSNEDAHRELMKLYAVTGSRHQALRQYKLCAEALRREIDAEPDQATIDLHERILSGQIQPATSIECSQSLYSFPIESPATRLIGRGRELEEIRSYLLHAQQGKGATMLIGGEAGVGKTRLVMEALGHARRDGVQILAGGCYEREGPLPYGPFVEALARCTSSVDKDEIARLAGDYAATLSHLVPAIGVKLSLVGDAVAEPLRDRQWLFAAVVGFLIRLSERAPVLLFLDDIHAADEDSLGLLHHLARAAPSLPLLIIGNFREEEVDVAGPFAGLIASLYREGLAVSLSLPPLRQADSGELVAELLGGETDSALREYIFDVAAGNPFFTGEITRAMVEQGRVEREEGRWVGSSILEAALPAGLRDWVRVRLERVDEQGQSVISLASVIGREAAFDLLLGAGSLEESALIDATDQLLRAQIFEATQGGFKFHHTLVREIVYDQISPARRAQLHRKVAESLEHINVLRIDDHIEGLAHHYTLGNQTEKAIHYLTLAGDRAAAVYANELAVSRYSLALELARSNRLSGQSALYEKLGDVQSLTGSAAIAANTYLAGTEAAEEESESVARLRRKAAYQLILQSRLDEAERQLDAAKKRFEGSDNHVELSRLHYAVAHLHWHREDFTLAKEAAETSLKAAEKAGSQVDKMLAYEALALTHLPLGDWKRGMEYESRRRSLCDLNRDIAAISDVHL